MGDIDIAGVHQRRWPGVIPTVATALFVALTIYLGNWQAGRAESKRALALEFDRRSADAVVTLSNGAIEKEDMQFRRVRVRGEYDAARTLFIDNRVYQGVVGYHVVTPLRIGTADRHILVNRGWLKAGPRRDVLPAVSTPAGVQTVEGIATVPPQRVFELAPDTRSGPLRQHLLPERLEAEWKIPLYPFVLQQTDTVADGLTRHWERPDTGMEKHRAYALQWYSFAALALVFYVFLGFRRARAA